MIKLIVTDMDGTFLNDNKEINVEFWEVFEKLKEKNIKFVVASGRQYQNLRKHFNAIKDDIIFIAENGSYVVEKEKEIYSQVLTKDEVKKFISLGREIKDTNLVLCGKKSAYIENDEKEFLNEVNKYYEERVLVKDLMEIVEKNEDEIIKIAFCNLKGTESNVYPFLKTEKNFQVVVSGEIWLDVSHLKSNKGIALEILKEKLGIDYDEVMIFGDYLNDYEMLQKGKYSFAMENAHDEVKKIANYLAKSNNENGVVEEIKKYI